MVVANGTGERSGPLNYAQRSWFIGWRHGEERQSHFTHPFVNNATIDVVVSQVDIDRVVHCLAMLVNRHEAFRTRIPGWPDEMDDQVVSSPLRRLADVLGPVTTWSDAAEAEVARRRLVATSFDLSRDWPFGAVLEVVGRGRVRLTLVVDHSALDGWGTRVVAKDLVRILALLDAGSRWDDHAPAFFQPLDMAAWERSQAGLGHALRAETHWSRQLVRARRVFDGLPGSCPDPGSTGSAPFVVVTRASRFCFQAARAAAKRHRTFVSAVYMMAVGRAILRIVDAPGVAIDYTAPNRRGKRQWMSGGLFYMRSPVIVEKRPDVTPREALRDVAVQQMKGQRFCHIDRDRLRDLIIAERFRDVSPLLTAPSFNYFDAKLTLAPIADRWEEVGRDAALGVDLPDERSDLSVVDIGGRPVKFEVFDDVDSARLRLTARTDVLPVDVCREILDLARAEVGVMATG